MAPYQRTTWVNYQAPPLSAANLNNLTNELKLQAATSPHVISHTLPTWTDDAGPGPALTSATALNEMERVTQQVAIAWGAAAYTPTVWQAGSSPGRNAANFNKLEAQAVLNRFAIDNAQQPVGTVYDTWSDLHSTYTPGDYVWVNHWYCPPTGNSLQSVSQTVPTPWPVFNGPASFEIATPYGNGWRFRCDASMVVGSGGKKSENHDNVLLSGMLGQSKTLTTHVMFPNVQTGWAPDNAWNDIIDFHSTSGADACIIGVNGDSGYAPVPCFFCHLVTSGVDKKGHTAAFNTNQWYEIKVEFNFTSAGTGHFNVYLDGVAFLTHSGPTISAGVTPYLQYGYYGRETPAYYNEIHFGSLVIS